MRQAEFLDVFFDLLLPGAGTHELVVTRDHHVGQMLRPFGDVLNVHRAGDVVPTVANVYAYSFLLFAHVDLLFRHGRHRQRLFGTPLRLGSGWRHVLNLRRYS